MKRLLELQFRTKLRHVRNYNEFWVCSACGTPRRLGFLHAVKRCGKCKSVSPALLVIQERRRPWEKESLSRSARSRAALEYILAAKPTLPGKTMEDILEEVMPKRGISKKVSGWFVQFCSSSGRRKGLLEFDPCSTYIPMEVRKQMSKTKMMQLRIPEDLHKWFKKYSQEYDTTMTYIIINYLERLRARTKKDFEVKQI